MAADSNDDELAKRMNEDLVKTEDLLAGFDRPGRTPRMPATRDFVDYHLDKRRAPPEPRPAPPPVATSSRDQPTAIIPHTKPRWRVWLPWVAILLALPVAGFLVVALLADSPPQERPATSPTLPTTSITRTSSAPPTTSGAERDIPPPPPPSAVTPPETATLTPAPPPTEAPRRATPATTTAAPSATAPATSPAPSSPNAKPTQNDDFIRNL